MSKRQIDIVFAVVAIIIVCLLMAAMSGCEESQQSVKVWGKGELPVEHQDFFGNDNTARLDYVQNRVLDKHGEILKIIAIRVLALEAVDPNAIPVETRLDLLESALIREAQGFRGANPIEGMVRWVPGLKDVSDGHLEIYDAKEWVSLGRK